MEWPWTKPRPPDIIRGYDVRGPFIECVGIRYRLESDCDQWIEKARKEGAYDQGFEHGRNIANVQAIHRIRKAEGALLKCRDAHKRREAQRRRAVDKAAMLEPIAIRLEEDRDKWRGYCEVIIKEGTSCSKSNDPSRPAASDTAGAVKSPTSPSEPSSSA